MILYRVRGTQEELELLKHLSPPTFKFVRWQLLECVVQCPDNTTLPALCRLFPTLECTPYGPGLH